MVSGSDWRTKNMRDSFWYDGEIAKCDLFKKIKSESESDIKSLEVYTKRLGEGNHYLVVKVNGKDVYYTKVNYDELTKNDASFKAVADKLLKDFYKSIIVDNLLVTLVFAIIQGILTKVDILAIKALGFIPLTDFGIFNTENDSLIFIILSLFAVFLFVTAIMNLLAVSNYKIGWKLWIIVGIVVSLFVGVGITFIFGVLDKIMTIRIDLRQLTLLIIPIILSYLAGFMVLKNTNIKNRIG